jgi:uncharacterized protein YdeI (YjbR/CyaY-like superfamily)
MALELQKLSFATAAAFRLWLEANHEKSPGIWLMIAKQARGVDSVTYNEAVDEAICFGWIDGQKAKHDDTYFLQRFTPRSKRSAWSAINTARVDRLTRANKMTPSGHSQVDAAKADGRWDAAYAGQASAVVPDDLQAALDASPAASAVFADLDGGNRYAILFRIGQAKRADTRARKIAEFVAELEQGRTPYPRKPGSPRAVRSGSAITHRLKRASISATSSALRDQLLLGNSELNVPNRQHHRWSGPTSEMASSSSWRASTSWKSGHSSGGRASLSKASPAQAGLYPSRSMMSLS